MPYFAVTRRRLVLSNTFGRFLLALPFLRFEFFSEFLPMIVLP